MAWKELDRLVPDIDLDCSELNMDNGFGFINNSKIRGENNLNLIDHNIINRSGKSSTLSGKNKNTNKNTNIINKNSNSNFKNFHNKTLHENFSKSDARSVILSEKSSNGNSDHIFSENCNDTLRNSDLHYQNSKISNSDSNLRSVRCFVNNVRGLASKMETLMNIICDNDYDIIALTETHYSGEIIPKLQGYRTFNRNRCFRNKGGICLFIKNNIANDVVLLSKGEGENEYLVVTLNCFSPKVALTLSYGLQVNTFGRDVADDNWREIFSNIKHLSDNGYDQIFLGDQNVHVGCDMIPNNDIVMSSSGKLFMDLMKENNMTFANNLSDEPATFIDPKFGTKRVLDLVVTNCIEKFSEFKTNPDKSVTPYSIKSDKNGGITRTYADHIPITFKFTSTKSVKVKGDKDNNKTKMFKKNTRDGDGKFEIFSNDGFEYLNHLISNEGDINKVYDDIENFIFDCKKRCYGLRSLTNFKFFKVEESKVWLKRLDALEQLAAKFDSGNINNDIYGMRNEILDSFKQQCLVAIKDPINDEILDEPDKIFEAVLKYNVDNMNKDEVAEETRQLMSEKDEYINQVLENVDDHPKTIEWESYLNVVKKICLQKKAVFQDFIKSGASFKLAMFLFVNRICVTEEIPEKMFTTNLTRLWKKRGDQKVMRNNRFIHSKSWLSKLTEKCIVEEIKKPMIGATPPGQVGGIPNRGCRDHLLKMTIVIKNAERNCDYIPMTFVDVKACFDKLRLDDLVYDTIKSGANLKATKLIKTFSEKIKIKISGDTDSDRCAVVTNTAGQGSNYAPIGASLSMGVSTSNNFKDSDSDCYKLGNVIIKPSLFVDDKSVVSRNTDAARNNGLRISSSLDDLGLKANCSKTVTVVFGKERVAQNARNNLSMVPVMVQGQETTVVVKETYLGMILHQDGVNESIKETVKSRTAKAWSKVPAIKGMVNDMRIREFGWLKAGILLFQSIVPSTMLYSVEAWLWCPKNIINTLEANYKKILYSILEIPSKTKFSAVLLETGLMRIRHVVAQMQITYLNTILWDDKYNNSQIREVVLEDHRINGDKSVITWGDKLCGEYLIGPLSKVYTNKTTVKALIKHKHNMEVLTDCVLSSAVRHRLSWVIKDKSYQRLEKMEAKAIIFYRTGALRFKSAWKIYNSKREGGIWCVSRLCVEPDSWEHMIKCPFYNTKYSEHKTDKELANYLVTVNRERFTRFKSALF